MPCPLHSPGHPPLGHQLGIDDDVALLEGDLITVRSSVVKLGYVVGATLDRRGGEGGVGSGLSGRGVGWSEME